MPWSALRATQQQFVLECKRATLETALAFGRDHWPLTAAYGWHERVHAHYHARPCWE